MPRGTRPTPEQKAAREQLTEARKATLERKKRTRRLIRMGGVLASYGFEEPGQVEQVVREALQRNRRLEGQIRRSSESASRSVQQPTHQQPRDHHKHQSDDREP